MSLQPVPILGLDGWVNTPKEKMDNLFMHFVEANKSQSNSASNLVYSFQYILADGAASKQKLKDELEKALTTYFESYYTSVTVGVKIVDNTQRPGTHILEIFLEAKDEYGKTYNLAKVSSDITSKTIRWANLNNFGDSSQFAPQD